MNGLFLHLFKSGSDLFLHLFKSGSDLFLHLFKSACDLFIHLFKSASDLFIHLFKSGSDISLSSMVCYVWISHLFYVWWSFRNPFLFLYLFIQECIVHHVTAAQCPNP